MNKNFRNIICALSLVICSLPLHAVIDNPITIAVLKVYDQTLAKNPKDYLTWFRRANEYYRHNEYARALEDVDKALAIAPASDIDLRFQAYMLRAGIFNQTGKQNLALADLNSAVALDPNSYAAIYQKANTEFELGDYSEARVDYTRLQRLNSRSTEALIGLARCAVVDNNLSAANEYLQQAVELDANNPEIYSRRASVRRQMGDHNGAVDDLISAISLRTDDPKAVEMLVDYGNTNYATTIDGLTNAIQLAPENGLYRYLRASIAQAHYNYPAALDDFNFINEQRLYDYHGIDASIAACLYGLGRYEEALNKINEAIGASSNVADYYVMRSKIQRALGRNNEAIDAAASALAVSHEYAPALVEMAINFIDKNDYSSAARLLGEAAQANPSDPNIHMLRGWLYEKYLNSPYAAQTNYEQALNLSNNNDRNVRSLRGFALLKLGRTAEADAWMENILNEVPDNDGLINYYAACYYDLRGDNEKALDAVERSLKAGYGDNHNWMQNTDGLINTASLRSDLRFLQLLQKYNSIFGN